MARIGCLVFILVVLVVGYDQYRITQVKNEMETLASKVHVENSGKKGQPANADLVTALAKAERYTKHARQLLDKHKTAQAEKELDNALASLKSANHVSSDMVGDTAQYLGKARDNAVRVFQKAWTDISREAKPKKIDVEK